MSWIDTIDNDFGHWFAGFADGEGCFMCDYDKRDGRHGARFVIGCRADDKDTLEYIQRSLGFGTLYTGSERTVKGTDYTSAPVTFLRIGRTKDCRKLVVLFDRYPLRSKKAKDYELWKELVCEMSRSVSNRDRKYMHELKVALTAIKEYSNNNVEMPESCCQQLGLGL